MKKSILGLFIFSIISAYSHSETFIQSLSDCNSNFFKEGSKNSELSNVINDFYNEKISEAEYIKPISLSDKEIKLTKFTVKYTDFDQLANGMPNLPTGKYYFWGFESNQPVEQVANSLMQKLNLIKISDSSYIYRPEYRDLPSLPWGKNEAPHGGTMPDKNSAEKLFILDSTNDGGTSIFCTLQGAINDKDLQDAGLIK